jgi:hypothetical protein
LLQENGSYVPVLWRKSALPFVSSMIPISNDKPVDSWPGVDRTWGIIATLSKQHEQLDVSQQTADNSQDANQNIKKISTISAFIPNRDNNEEIIREADDHQKGDDFDDILVTEHDVFNDFIDQKGDDPDTDILDPIMIEGPPELKLDIRSLLEEHRSVFATTLLTEPAKTPPFELEVNLQKWKSYSNRGPPRTQDPAKQAEILRQVDELLRTGIIEPSTSSYYFQVILASKPDDTWRFCIDYRKLNDCTKSASWPKPNIQQMLGILGTHHSDIFCIMNLTAGYQQALISLGTRVFLAFICFCGIFQFRRLSFGPVRIGYSYYV